MYPMKVSESGRVVIPVEVRRALGVKDGDTVVWEIKDGVALLTTQHERLRQAQALFQKYLPPQPGRSQVDEFIAERRIEAERE